MGALRSVIVNYLEQTFPPEQNVGIAYLYCAYEEQNQTAANLIASLMKQFIKQLPEPSDSILRLYRLHRERETRPSVTEFSRLLRSEIRQFSKVFIVVDALDEYSEDNGTREHFLAGVRNLLPMIRLLVTSRYLANIEHEFRDTPRLEIRASEPDIKRYIEGCIKRQLPLADHVRTDSALRDDILNAVVERAGGMYVLNPSPYM